MKDLSAGFTIPPEGEQIVIPMQKILSNHRFGEKGAVAASPGLAHTKTNGILGMTIKDQITIIYY